MNFAKKLPLTFVITAFFSIITITSAHAQVFQTKAKQAVVMDYETGTVLYQKNADELIPPASLAKLMTMAVVFDALKKQRLTLDDKFRISEDAWRRGGANSGGSSMFAQLNDDIRLEDLIRGVIVQSGNDASIAIAEGMAGSELAFAGLMNQLARRIGLEKSQFRNATGLHDDEQVVTARELAYLARHIIREHPDYYPIYAEPEFKWGRINQRNRNPLLGNVDGADGLKTGYTEQSGYALVGSAVQDGRRVIIVMSGLESIRERSEEAVKMMRWGFLAFQPVELFAANETVGEAKVYGGARSGVPLRAEGPLKIFVPIGFRDRLKMQIVFQGPLIPPVEEGAQVAKLQVLVDDNVSQETLLYAAERVEKGTITQRATDAVQELLVGLLRFD